MYYRLESWALSANVAFTNAFLTFTGVILAIGIHKVRASLHPQWAGAGAEAGQLTPGVDLKQGTALPHSAEDKGRTHQHLSLSAGVKGRTDQYLPLLAGAKGRRGQPQAHGTGRFPMRMDQ